MPQSCALESLGVTFILFYSSCCCRELSLPTASISPSAIPLMSLRTRARGCSFNPPAEAEVEWSNFFAVVRIRSISYAAPPRRKSQSAVLRRCVASTTQKGWVMTIRHPAAPRSRS
ncbi:hypothetical protein FB45DRAFT_28786 [Roridomyces roridus]|uniref:Uncharacterized protein n=1 Tax=Roridomyces roridus TaxID=1738132 RepID=A0AAD7CKA6_9AGAR|nr:hypothetical protein FB45DRAFT_28786 [Roridomyces roridus]